MLWRVTALFLTATALVWSVYEVTHDRLPAEGAEFASVQLRQTF